MRSCSRPASCRCLVATSSLELGIDMGAVDLVIQVESPKSVARGLQRIGRSGHGVGGTSKGRIFPKFRADLLECAVVARLMREGAIEPTVVPRNALDVLAQQIVAIAASAEEIRVDDLFALVTRAHSYSELARELLENVLDSGSTASRYPSSEFGELRPRIAWDRIAGTIRARKGAQKLAVVNAGTIPDRGLFAVTLPDGRRVGELDEEMVYEARPGQTFLLGATAWRIEEIGRDRVIVTPAPGAPGAVPFWRGDSVGRPKALGEAVGAFSRWALDQPAEVLERDYDLDPLAARNLLEFLGEQQAATGVIPSDRTIVVERFRDEIGDWRLCVLTPFGGRIHAAWALALSARIRERYGLEADAIWSDDGIVIHLPDADEPPDAELVLPEADELRGADRRRAVLASALFGARFRENASRSLLIPRAYPGKRTPLWQQRLKAQSLLEVARDFPRFPVILETYRECLRDVLDLPGLDALLRRSRAREISLVEVETPTASPFASSLLFDYVATYMYEGDAPNAERRAAALSLDRELLRELLGQEELRELIDPLALETLEADLQRRSPSVRPQRRRAPRRPARAWAISTPVEAARARPGPDLDAGRDAGGAAGHERRAIEVRIARVPRASSPPNTPGSTATRSASVPPSGLPEVFLAEVPRGAARAGRAPRAHAWAVHHGGVQRALRRRPAERAARARARRRAGARRAASLDAPARASRRTRVVRPRGAAPPAPRLAGRPPPRDRTGRAARAGGLPALLAGSGPPSRGGRRRRAPARGTRAAPGSGAARRAVGARRAAAPARRLLARVARPALRGRRAGVDRRGRDRRGARAGSRCTSARTPRRDRLRLAQLGRRSAEPVHEAIRAPRAPLRASSAICSRSSTPRRGACAQEALWDLVWAGRGDERRVGAAARLGSRWHARPAGSCPLGLAALRARVARRSGARTGASAGSLDACGEPLRAGRRPRRTAAHAR